MLDANRRSRAARALRGPAALLCAVALLAPAASFAASHEDRTQFEVRSGALTFSKAPAMPLLKAVTLTGAAQTTAGRMTSVGVDDASGTNAGWNLTVAGLTGTGDSPVFAQYCPKALCGTVKEGYVAGGSVLPANSLTLNSTGAVVTPQKGAGGPAPSLQCAALCDIDHGTATKVISAAAGSGAGVWLAKGFAAASLQLSTPASLRALAAGEVYRVNVIWTLSTGP